MTTIIKIINGKFTPNTITFSNDILNDINKLENTRQRVLITTGVVSITAFISLGTNNNKMIVFYCESHIPMIKCNYTFKHRDKSITHTGNIEFLEPGLKIIRSCEPCLLVGGRIDFSL